MSGICKLSVSGTRPTGTMDASTPIAGMLIDVGGGAFGTAAQFSTATGSLVTSGATEDGWAGINYGLTNYTFRPGAAVNFIRPRSETFTGDFRLLACTTLPLPT